MTLIEISPDEDTWDDDNELTEEQMLAIEENVALNDDDDDLWGDGGMFVDPDKDPHGWDIADYIDWDSFDYE